MLWWAEESVGTLHLSSGTAPTWLSTGGPPFPWGSGFPLERQMRLSLHRMCVKNERLTRLERLTRYVDI